MYRSSRGSRLYDKVSKVIALKNCKLRRFAALLLDENFLRFVELVEDLEYELQETVYHRGTSRCCKYFLQNLGSNIDRLCTATSSYIEHVENSFGLPLSETDHDRVQKTFNERLESILKCLANSYDFFHVEQSHAIGQVSNGGQVRKLKENLKRTEFLQLVVVANNLRNSVHHFDSETFGVTYRRNSLDLKLEANRLATDLLTDYQATMDDLELHASESVREKLNLEISKSRTDLNIREVELESLRKRMFASETSLKQQRTFAIEQHERKGLDLEEQIRTIDMLQFDIHGLEDQVSKLIIAREKYQEQLLASRARLREGVREIVRLERLIEQIERDISARLVRFQQEIEELEDMRLKIMADPNLSEEEKQRLLAELDEKIVNLQRAYVSDTEALEAYCDELKLQAKSVTEDIDAFKEEVLKKHNEMIEELERRKLNATPSELLLIEEEIQQLRAELTENLEMLERAHSRYVYLTDEHGRYYIDEHGNKIYQRYSGASLYRMTSDGQLVKFEDATPLEEDDRGFYRIDKFGQKIYVKKFFEDERGKYFVNEFGERIYETVFEEEITSKSKASSVQSPEESESSMPPSSDLEVQVSEESQRKIASDVQFIQDTVGPALRKGLAAIALLQPEDPIEYLAQYLEKYHEGNVEKDYRKRMRDRFCK